MIDYKTFNSFFYSITIYYFRALDVAYKNMIKVLRDQLILVSVCLQKDNGVFVSTAFVGKMSSKMSKWCNCLYRIVLCVFWGSSIRWIVIFSVCVSNLQKCVHVFKQWQTKCVLTQFLFSFKLDCFLWFKVYVRVYTT